MIKVAILVDGSFFIKRFRTIYKNQSGFDKYDATFCANEFYTIALRHLNKFKQKKEKDKKTELPIFNEYLYRILYYDCHPFSKRIHNPITNRCLDFSKSPEAIFKMNFFEELKKRRKVALRLGEIKDHAGWTFYKKVAKNLIKKKIEIDDLKENDVYYDMTQKGVDMKIGLDIASLAYKKLVDKIILISGDSDFIPAAKVARREGLDFVLDPMWNHVDENLLEHIDGLQSTCQKPKSISKKK